MTSTEVLLGLGRYRFAVSTAAHSTLRRQTEYRWPEQARIGVRPARQFMGIGGDTIEVNGVIYPHFAGGFGQVDAMRAEAETGEPLMLVSGLGYVMGKWCILAIEETQATAWRGTPRKIDFRLQLGHYGEDGE